MNDQSRYEKRGVSAKKEDVKIALEGHDKGIFPKAFCRIVPDLIGRNSNFCNVFHADGAGTKSSLAYIYYKETDNVEIFNGIAQDCVVMNLDDMFCVGASNRTIVVDEVISTRPSFP